MASNRGRGSDNDKRPNTYAGRISVPNAKVWDVNQINDDDDNPVVVGVIKPGFYDGYKDYLGNIRFKIKAFGGQAKFLLNSCVDQTRISVEGRVTGDVWEDAPVSYYDREANEYVNVLDDNGDVITQEQVTPLIEIASVGHSGSRDLTDEAYELLEKGLLFAEPNYDNDNNGGGRGGGGGRSSGGGGRSSGGRGGRSSGRSSSGRSSNDDDGGDEKRSSGHSSGRSSGGRSSGGRSSGGGGRSSSGRSSGGRSSGGRSSGGRSSGGRSSKNVGDDV